MFKKAITILICLGWMTSMVAAAPDTLLYLNFDEAADGTFADGATYTLGSTELYSTATVDTGILQLIYRNNGGDGPSIGTPPAGLTGTSQGGKALLVDSGAG